MNTYKDTFTGIIDASGNEIHIGDKIRVTGGVARIVTHKGKTPRQSGLIIVS